MTELRVHPKTVTKLSKGELETHKRRKNNKSKPKSSKVVALKWEDIEDGRVRTVARSIASNDRRRVEILGPAEVIVYNHPRELICPTKPIKPTSSKPNQTNQTNQ